VNDDEYQTIKKVIAERIADIETQLKVLESEHSTIRGSLLQTEERGFLHRPDRTRVLRHQGIDGQECDALDSRLCH
jgi:hypothetical protein